MELIMENKRWTNIWTDDRQKTVYSDTFNGNTTVTNRGIIEELGSNQIEQHAVHLHDYHIGTQ